jgi:hypothetical protein
MDAEKERRIHAMQGTTIRVLVIHECPLVCASLRHLLESQPDLIVVGEAPRVVKWWSSPSPSPLM